MTADSPTPPPQTGTSWTAGRILLVVLGSILALLAAGLLAAGGTLLWVDRAQRDDDGFLTTPTERFESDSFAITSDSIDLLESESDWLFSEGVLGEVRITGEDGDVFIGIGETEDVEAYLAGVAHDEVRDLEFDPFRVEYRQFPGGELPGPPGEQTFWAASASGSGEQSATWEAESGEWTVVVMNSDASRGVSADVSAGAEANFLLWLAIGLLIAGSLLLAGGVTMIVIGARGTASAAPAARRRPQTDGAPVACRPQADAHRLPGRSRRPASIGAEPLALGGQVDPRHPALHRARVPLARIPRALGRRVLRHPLHRPLPPGDLRLQPRRAPLDVAGRLLLPYSALGTDRYPPFTLAEQPDYPATLDVAYPERLSHWLPLVKWLLAIPHVILVGIFVGGWGWGWGEDVWWFGAAGLVGILVVIAGFVLLFTGSYPRSLFDFTLGLDRWVFRTVAYLSLMRDEYPPFRLDMGEAEPAAPAESPPPATQA